MECLVLESSLERGIRTKLKNKVGLHLTRHSFPNENKVQTLGRSAQISALLTVRGAATFTLSLAESPLGILASFQSAAWGGMAGLALGSMDPVIH